MTLPSSPPGDDPGRAPHHYRQTAEAFGSDTERYDRTRPRYPEAMVERIVAGSPGPAVLDIGCGTGIEAHQFRAAGATVLAVEPDARMAEFARRSGIEVEQATFEAWDPAGRVCDVIIAGTAWHWVDPIVGAAKAARLLRPGGRLAPFHHVFQAPPELVDAFAGLYRLTAASGARRGASDALARSAVQAYQPLFTRMADGIRQAGEFNPPEQWRFDWERSYSRDQWLDQLPTLGGMTQLPRTLGRGCSTPPRPRSVRSAADSRCATPPWSSPRPEPPPPETEAGCVSGWRRGRRRASVRRCARRSGRRGCRRG